MVQDMMSLVLLVLGCILAPAAQVLASDQSLRRSLAATDSEDLTPSCQLSWKALSICKCLPVMKTSLTYSWNAWPASQPAYLLDQLFPFGWVAIHRKHATSCCSRLCIADYQNKIGMLLYACSWQVLWPVSRDNSSAPVMCPA